MVYSYTIAASTSYSCASFSAAIAPCNSAGNGLYTKMTACTAGTPAPASGLWLKYYSSSSCSSSSFSYMVQGLSGVCASGQGPTGGSSYSKAVCTTDGGAQMWYYTNSGCTGNADSYTSLSSAGLTLSACTASGTSSSQILCYGAQVAPFSFASRTCGGSSLPTSVSSASLTCFTGAVNASSFANSAVYPTDAGGGFKLCVALTGRMNGNLVRYYYGAQSLEALNQFAAGQFTGVVDVSACTTNKCNNPATDACATNNGALPVLSSMLCGGAPASGVPPTPSGSNIKCFNNINAPSTALQTAASGNLCVTLTHLCQASDPFPNCAGKAGTAVRVYSDVATITTFIGFTLQHMYSFGASGALFSSSYPARATMNDLSLCNTEGCNSPTADTCALATAPVTAAVVFNTLPPAAVDSTGKLTDAAKNLLTNSIKAAVNANGCATCTVTLKSVVDSTGKTLYSAARRLQTGAVTVTFSAVGGSAAALSAVASAASAPSFTSTVTAAVVQSGGAAYAGVTAAAAPASGGSPPSTRDWEKLGLLGLLGLLLVVPAVWWFFCRHKKAEAPPAPGLVLSAFCVPAAQTCRAFQMHALLF